MTDVYYDINKVEKINPDYEIKIQAENIIKNHPVYFFDTEEFHLYHQKNAKEVFKIIFTEESSVTGFCYIGITHSDKLKAPYSSPFSDIYIIKKPDSILLENILSCIKRFSDNMNLDLYFTLPPIICDKDYAVKTASFLDGGFKLDYAHVNNYYDLKKIDSAQSFPENQSHSFRKNIKRAINSDLKLVKNDNELSNEALSETSQNSLIDDTDIRAYNIIRKNREEKQFPLAMSFDQIKAVENMRASQVDYFIVSMEKNDIAAAIVFKVSEEMVQVIYWGSLEDYSKCRPMEFLAMSLIEHYKKLGVSYIDIGPSTVDDKISHGLLAFKKNIGCKTTLKMTFVYKK